MMRIYNGRYRRVRLAPAIGAGIADHVGSIDEIVALLEK